VIRLRRILERGRAHPILGPILLIALVVALALLLIHAAHDGGVAATEAGAICLGVATFLGLLLIERLRSHVPVPLILARGDRGPPSRPRTHDPRPNRAAALLALPLRR
jgi:hypothetical protein